MGKSRSLGDYHNEKKQWREREQQAREQASIANNSAAEIAALQREYDHYMNEARLANQQLIDSTGYLHMATLAHAKILKLQGLR